MVKNFSKDWKRRYSNVALRCAKAHTSYFQEQILHALARNKEYGCVICQDDYGVFTLGPYCEGTECSVGIVNCENKKHVGVFHTHYHRRLFGAGYPSIEDLLISIYDLIHTMWGKPQNYLFDLIGFYIFGSTWIMAYTVNYNSDAYTTLYHDITKIKDEGKGNLELLMYTERSVRTFGYYVRAYYDELCVPLFRCKLKGLICSYNFPRQTWGVRREYEETL